MRPTSILPLLPDEKLQGGEGSSVLESGNVKKLGCIARGWGKWSDLRKDFSPLPVIEDLTHKTGNFKQFNIFCNMLESALTQVGTGVGDGGGFFPWIPGG